jgi:hypothetical protein
MTPSPCSCARNNYYDYKQVSTSVYGFLTTRKNKLKVFLVSIANINKVLAKKKFTDLKTRLLD